MIRISYKPYGASKAFHNNFIMNMLRAFQDRFSGHRKWYQENHYEDHVNAEFFDLELN